MPFRITFRSLRQGSYTLNCLRCRKWDISSKGYLVDVARMWTGGNNYFPAWLGLLLGSFPRQKKKSACVWVNLPSKHACWKWHYRVCAMGKLNPWACSFLHSTFMPASFSYSGLAYHTVLQNGTRSYPQECSPADLTNSLTQTCYTINTHLL